VRRGGFVALTLASLAVLAAACGASPNHSVASIGSTTPTTGKPAPAAGTSPVALGSALEKYAACMRSHGVAGFPSPTILGQAVRLQLPPSITGTPQFKKAQTVCQYLLPPRPTNANYTTQQQADYLKAAECMRSHGIAGFPDPSFSGGQVHFTLPPGMNANSTQFLKARVICEKFIPQGLPYSS
jgi:hypothetical protein